MMIKFRKLFDDLWKAFIYINAGIGVLTLGILAVVLALPSLFTTLFLDRYTTVSQEFKRIVGIPAVFLIALSSDDKKVAQARIEIFEDTVITDDEEVQSA